MKTALLFSGQGAQYSGMGKDLYDNSPEAKKIFDIAGQKIKDLCFEGSKEELSKTENTQICVYTMSMAVFEALKDKIKFEAVAGFSLGEYSALTAVDVFSFEEGLELLKKRSKWMMENAEGKGGMVASLGSNEKTLELVSALDKEYRIQAVNYNCPGQIVVAGENEAIKVYLEKAKDYGLKCIPLAVSGPFHSQFLTPVIDDIYNALDTMNLKKPKVPVVSNVTARYMEDNIKELVSKQVASPVKWQDSIEFLISKGFDTFIEVGCGKTLAGLCKKIDKTKNIYNVENIETLNKVLEEIKF